MLRIRCRLQKRIVDNQSFPLAHSYQKQVLLNLFSSYDRDNSSTDIKKERVANLL